MDASDLAKPGRSRFSLEEETIDRLGGLIGDWRMRNHIDKNNWEIATVVHAGSIEDTNLDPRRYQKISQVNLETLENKVHESRAKVVDSMQRVQASLATLDDYLGGGRWHQ